jgi:hypothetical protein
VPINRPLYNVNESGFPRAKFAQKFLGVYSSAGVAKPPMWGTDVTLFKHNGDCI